MKNERDREQKSGKSWIGPFIVSAIDRTLRSKQSNNQGSSDRHCVSLTDLIITPLVIEKVPNEILEHLKLEFVLPADKDEPAEQNDEDLLRIKQVLTAEFGNEVIKRLKLSLVKERVRNFPTN